MSGGTLRLEAVSRRYHGEGGVRDVSLSFPAGAVTALLGASGSGKSTLLRIVAGLEPIETGRVTLDGDAISKPGRLVPPERRRIGLVFQDQALFPHMTALGNVAFGLHAWPKAERQDRAAGWLERVGLGARALAYPHMLSGGEQQRVALARALAPEPRAILLDEPFSGLDPMLRATLRDVTLEALRLARTTAVFVTHDAEEALYVADRLAILKDGALLQAGEPRAVYRFPTSVAAAAALGPVNTAPAHIEQGTARCAFGSAPAPNLPEGARAVLAARAEAIMLRPAEDGVGAARVVERRAQGAQDIVRIEAAGLVWRALTPANAGPVPGEAVQLSFLGDGCFVFPENSFDC